jgi:SAM-dependent methyltransferase
MKFPDSLLAHRHLDSRKGIEIGASAHNPFNLPGRIANVDDTAETTIFKLEEHRLCGEMERVDVVAPADKLPWGDGELGYVLSSHVLEHVYDPIGAINEWARVLEPGGLVFCVLPHKERTFDAHRPRTTLAELKRRYARPRPEELAHEGHKNVWITTDGVELFIYCDLEILDVLDVDDKVGNGFTIVARKPRAWMNIP